jgi:hypothetical protein
MKSLVIIFIFIFTIGCTKINTNPFNSVDYLASLGVNILYKDQLGNTLFTNATNGLNGYYRSNVITYCFDGNNNIIYTYNKLFYSPDNSSLPLNSPVIYDSLLRLGNYYGFQIRANLYLKYQIHLKQGMDDTLLCHVNSEAQFDTIWYNGSKITATSNPGGGPPYGLTIIK